MSIEKLTSLVPPPTAPVRADVDWTETEAALGLSLPAEFKELVRLYGEGQFCDEFDTCSPGRLRIHNQELTAQWRSFREEHPGRFRLPLYPEPSGLLVWGFDNNGGALCWRTEGEPDAWQVVRWLRRDIAFHEWDGGAVEYLTAQIGSLLEEFEEEGEPVEAPWFTPACP
ncbi:SMI1/KNR4 family protein [Streptomyces sp. CA-250714]|uniref:SMI1/KNR4 family protein n=1 Tax=Streptomyces sp. CA-250714 TaxID=3240060 RepID=UPI003D8EEFDE